MNMTVSALSVEVGQLPSNDTNPDFTRPQWIVDISMSVRAKSASASAASTISGSAFRMRCASPFPVSTPVTIGPPGGPPHQPAG